MSSGRIFSAWGRRSGGCAFAAGWTMPSSMPIATASTGRAVYWSRSRRRLWRKGEESGHVQQVREIRLDCDGDVVLLQVEQAGDVACHTGRHACFFTRLDAGRWVVVDPLLVDPERIYR